MAKTVFADGNPATGTLGTIVTAAFLNAQNNHRHTGRDTDGDGAIDYAAATGAGNAYAIALTPALDAYITGMPIIFKANHDNTGAATLAVNGMAAKAIKKNISEALAGGDIKNGQIVIVVYDGVNFQLISHAGASDEPVYNLKLVRNASVNKLDLFTVSGGAAPDASNPIGIAIPDGAGVTVRTRSGPYLNGTSQIIMADASNYWSKGSVADEIKTAWLYAIWDGTGIVWALSGYSGFNTVPTTTTVTDDDFFLLEAGSTYVRNAAHYCVAVAKIRYEYDTADSPDHTIQASGNNAPQVIWNPKSDYTGQLKLGVPVTQASDITEQSFVSTAVKQSGSFLILASATGLLTGGTMQRINVRIRTGNAVYATAVELNVSQALNPITNTTTDTAVTFGVARLNTGDTIHVGAAVMGIGTEGNRRLDAVTLVFIKIN